MRSAVLSFRYLITRARQVAGAAMCTLGVALAVVAQAQTTVPASAATATAPATSTATRAATARAATAIAATSSVSTIPAPAAPAKVTTIPFTPMSTPAPNPGVKKAPAPTTAVDAKTCTTADCHPEVKDYPAVHGPVNVDACDACHKLTDPAKHAYELTRPKNQMCTFCHKMDSVSGMGGAGGALPVVHQPVKTGDCLPCHNPHGGKTTKLVRGDSLQAVCNQCHQDVVGKKKNVHGPVAAGACEACHSPHASQNPKLLVASGKSLCLSCHKEMGDQLKAAKVTHKPVMEGECSACHDPHASDFKMQVKADPFTMCTSCHEHDKIKAAALGAKYKHSIVTQDQACMNCHTPHGGPLAKLMKAKPVDVCIKCHKIDVKAPDGRVVKGVPEVVDPKLIKHGPVQDGTCSGCHNVHGSDVSRLLTKPYPESFYAKYDPDNFALCFSCHDKKLVEAKEAEGLTGFRNGTQNLHFVHVDKDKGRTCRACHETHASPNPVHLRQSVPFGQWDLPLNYQKTATGGTCAPGCHKQYGYDRVKAVDNAAQATQPATDSAPAPNAPATTSATAPATTPTATRAAPAGASAPAPATGILNLPQ
jgi:predicted CXXCH cytochrome family protein